MFYLPLEYEQPLFRPPSEANSVIFQITFGCTWNKCAFCEMYASKKFRIKKESDIINELKAVRQVYPDVQKVFLADGNAMALSTERLLRVLEAIRNYFPSVRRISSYALPSNILSKTKEELLALKNAGLHLLYIGIESGDDEVLKRVNKGETFLSTEQGLLMAKAAGMKLSVIILNGIGGRKYSSQHAKNSAKVLNAIQPEYASTLVLSFPYGVERYKQRFDGEYISMSILDIIYEMEIFISHTELTNTVFRSDHASNYLVLRGNLSRDKQRFLDKIQYALNNPQNANLRAEWQRGL